MKDTLIKRKEVLEYVYMLKEKLGAQLKEKLGRQAGWNQKEFEFFDGHFRGNSFHVVVPELREIEEMVGQATNGSVKACVGRIKGLYKKRQALADLTFLLNRLDETELSRLRDAFGMGGDVTFQHRFNEKEAGLLEKVCARLGLECVLAQDNTATLRQLSGESQAEYPHLSDSGETVWVDIGRKCEFLKTEEDVSRTRREIIALATLHQAREFTDEEKKKYDELQNSYLALSAALSGMINDSNIAGMIMPGRELVFGGGQACSAEQTANSGVYTDV